MFNVNPKTVARWASSGVLSSIRTPAATAASARPTSSLSSIAGTGPVTSVVLAAVEVAQEVRVVVGAYGITPGALATVRARLIRRPDRRHATAGTRWR